MIGSPNTFVIFDCSRPSYIDPNGRLIVLKNHVLNDHLERIQHPLYNDTDAYMCDKALDNVWHINPSLFHETGYIGFDHSQPGEADRNFVTYADEKAIRAYLIHQPTKITEKIVNLALRIIHHPKFTSSVQNKKKLPIVVDVFEERDKKLPESLRQTRMKQMNELYEKITAPASNFSIEDGPG